MHAREKKEVEETGSSLEQNAISKATAYATLALVRHGDNLNASRAAKWLVSKRNAYGGYGSTQDTVMALQALIEFSIGSKSDVDLTINLTYGGKPMVMGS
jgi:CD109 antigen